jgi:hypothetical protein
MATLKHVGRIKSTGKRVVVAYRTLPGDAHHALVVLTEGLTDSYHNALISAVESNAGQEAYEFAEAMDRTQTPDGYNMLQAFHGQGKLVKLPTADIEMLPSPGAVVLLSELNQIIAEQRGVPVDELSVKPSEAELKRQAQATELRTRDLGEPKTAEDDVAKTTSSSVNESVDFEIPDSPTATPESRAKQYRSQADKLAKQAAEFRRKAEELVPTVKKKSIDVA